MKINCIIMMDGERRVVERQAHLSYFGAEATALKAVITAVDPLGSGTLTQRGPDSAGYYHYLHFDGTHYYAFNADSLLDHRAICFLFSNIKRDPRVALYKAIMSSPLEYTDVRDDPKIVKIKAEISETTAIMQSNIDKVTARGEQIENLLEKSEHLLASAVNFKTQSAKLRWKEYLSTIGCCCFSPCIPCCITCGCKPCDSDEDSSRAVPRRQQMNS